MKTKLVLLAIMAVAMMVPSANAAVCTTSDCTYTFDSTAVAGFGAAPYGTVELILNAGGWINFIVDLADGFHIVNTGTHEAFTFNNTLSGGVTISNISGTLATYTQAAGPFNNPGFSTFTDGLVSNCNNGSGCGDNVLTFRVTRNSGVFTDVNQLVALSTGSGTAAFFSADAAKDLPAGTEGSRPTGPIGVTHVPTATPEPITSGLVGTGLIGLFFLRRRKA